MQHEVEARRYSPDNGGLGNTSLELHDHLLNLADQVQDDDLKNKLRELAQKAHERQFMLAMCGHFSAGKSTIINQLCGRQLLPSSPIPTSANVVTIRYGDSRVQLVRRTEEGAHRLVEEVPLAQLEEACRDGEQVERVTIYEPLSWLESGTALLDTPGVDSTDPLHREATESALHMADVVVYMTDYNHVQSELNFDFAKKVQEAGKPLIWVVNQIDKHREQELPFSTYQHDVSQALTMWGIEPLDIYYISMKKLDHPHNEWEQLKAGIEVLVQESGQLAAQSIIRAAIALLKEYEERELEPLLAKYELWQESVGGEEAASVLHEKAASLESNMQQQLAHSAEVREQTVRELDKLLKDANITPAVLRDAAAHYLGSMRPGFKVGLLFSSKKTEQEKESRLQELCQRFRHEVQGNIIPHVLTLIRHLASAAGGDEAQMVEQMEQAFPAFTEQWFQAAVQPSSAGSGEYTLNYCRTQSELAKSSIRKAVLAKVDELISMIQRQDQERAAAIHEELRAFEDQLEREKQIQQEMEQVQACCLRYQAMLPELTETAEARLRHALKEMRANHPSPGRSIIQESDDSGTAIATTSSENVSAGSWAPFAAREQHAKDRMHRVQELLEHASHTAAQFPALASLCASLKEKNRRIAHQQYTAALFGAFSAGKSSFANALFGESVLPVSPNPTTAAINQISLARQPEDHRTAAVRLKTEDRLLDDMRYACARLGADHTQELSMKETLHLAAAWKPEQVHPAGRPYYSFIQAVAEGYKELSSSLGQVQHVQEEEYRQFVAVERKSAFVERIDLLLDSPWTQSGFTFVDTPGADSVNARHTGVSFEYIKNADVILFVTYYNHAFSQADRQFLTQLGRVKDAFELDKMFFIVNACDLAASNEELDSVLQYVKERLQEFGIRNPRLFPVSSLRGLEAKQIGDQALHESSGFLQFEQAFHQFVDQELSGMVAQAAISDVEKLRHQLLTMNHAAKQDSRTRESRLLELKVHSDQAAELIAAEDGSSTQRFLIQESEELLYHVKQRIMYRSHDSFAHAFNPATLRGDDKHITSALVQSLRDWESTLTLELTNELLATSLRVEQYAKRELLLFIKRQWEQVTVRLNDYDPEDWKPGSWTTPTIQLTAEWMEKNDPLSERELMALYKSSKHFFTGGGREKLRARLDERAEKFITAAIQAEQSGFAAHAWAEWQRSFVEWQTFAVEKINIYKQSMTEALSDPRQIERLEAAIEELDAALRLHS